MGTVVLRAAMIALVAPTARSGPMRPGAIVRARIDRSDPTVLHAAATVRHPGIVRSARIVRHGRKIARRRGTVRSARTVLRAVATVRHPVIVRSALIVPRGRRIVQPLATVRSARTVPRAAVTVRRPVIVRTAETAPTGDTPLSVVAVPTAGARAVDVSCGRATALRLAATETRSGASAS
ncbi:hypothetical protein [Plantibacter sp. ME-Dv--P-122b]|uniref:hypothetical protein n=1 Tax=Plantibacter sp. ME-Dv--P-122b TaxID=3040300 RepID=UPI002551559C|nr:hypothetical protein [Plantibacter sp. ME-Dv--P-122b]